MVDVSHKPVTSRFAIASGKIHLSEEAIHMVQAERSHKGNILGVAEIAAIMAAKRTSDIIPLCHPLPLSHVGVAWDVRPKDGYVVVMVTIHTEGRTGVEMEALLGVTVALVTVFDMTKSVSHDHIISDVKVLEKAGGKTGHTHFHTTN
jgi:cyclic pyranopterin phosphate synthase